MDTNIKDTNEAADNPVDGNEENLNDVTGTDNQTVPVSEAEQQSVNPVELIQQELSIANDKYLRLYSEFDNFKKRKAKERIDLIRSAGADTIISLLPVLDDFDRAIRSFETTQDINAVKEGIQLINSKFNNILSQKGLRAMDAKGSDFDADLHEAITTVPTDDETQRGKVMDEVEKGYYLNDKVVRHAKVVVFG